MKFEFMDNSCTFVEIQDQGIDIIALRGYSYPFDCYYLLRYEAVQISCIPLRLVCNGSLVGDERRAAFFTFYDSNFVDTMTKENEICKGVKRSNTRTRTPRRNEGKLLSEIKELQKQLDQMTQKFEIEKNAKNRAYYFVISSGNFKRFAEYCKKHPATLDYHGACVAQLYLDSLTNKEY